MAEQDADLSFEAIDAHIRRANLGDFAPTTAAATPGDVLARVCEIYRVIRPILQGILLIPFIPASWKAAIRTFMTLMDTLCPG